MIFKLNLHSVENKLYLFQHISMGLNFTFLTKEHNKSSQRAEALRKSCKLDSIVYLNPGAVFPTTTLVFRSEYMTGLTLIHHSAPFETYLPSFASCSSLCGFMAIKIREVEPTCDYIMNSF